MVPEAGEVQDVQILASGPEMFRVGTAEELWV